jgi:hypothetical protein
LNIYQKVSVVVALSLYLPLGYQILRGTVVQNLATFALWGALDAIASASIFLQGGNYQLPAVYVLGCIITILCILKARTFGWTRYETQVSIVVLECIVAWKVSGPWYATIFSTAGVVFAGLPQLKDSWMNPEKSPLYSYIGFSFVNLMNTIGGKAWTVEERFYPFWCTILCVAIVLVSMRQMLPEEVETR